MKPFIRHLLASVAVCATFVIASCGGESGSMSMSNASATGLRYGQTLTVAFNGLGLDKGVDIDVSGPCTSPARVGTGSASLAQFSCSVTGVGRVVLTLVDASDRQGLGSLRVDIPTPQVSMTVSDGARSGTVVLEIDPTVAPRSAQQFMAYVTAGFYVGTVFHRVSPAAAILGGGFTSATDSIISAKAPTRGDVALEATRLRNLRGAIALYREAGPDSANSMFFINTVDNPGFDAGSAQTPLGYAVFGKVTQGLEVVDEIAKVPVRPDLSLGVSDVPVTPVRITAMTQVR